MSVLGLTWRACSVPGSGPEPEPEQVSVRPCGEFGIVVAPQGLAETPRDRLVLQARVTLAVASFLPFRADRPVPLAVAEAWLAGNADAARGALADLAETCQLVVDLRQIGPAPDRPADWLRHRAARINGPARLTGALAPVTLQSRTRATPEGAIVQFLVGRARLDDFRAAVQDAALRFDLAGWSGLVSGPWAPGAFHGVSTP